MNLSFLLPFIGTVLVLFLILKVLSLPFKIIKKLIINAIVGGITIFLVNLIGGMFGFTILLTWWTAIIVGILGFPGVIILAILQFIL